MSDLIRVEPKGNVLYIILNRPEKLNALIEPMRQEMAGVIESLHSRNDVHVCVVTGAGRGFCAGGDIRIMEELIRNGDFDRV